MRKKAGFTDYRSDLATDWNLQPGNGIELDTRRDIDGVVLTRIAVTTDEAASAAQRPRGVYLTAELAPLTDNEPELCRLADILGTEMARFLPPSGEVLVVGLGNRRITPDALGPQTADLVLATRHIGREFAEKVGLTDLRPVAVVSPGVLGQTGMESVDVVRAICRALSPAAVIVIDAMAARFADRIGCTVQISHAGIIPGAGVGNHRKAINRDVLGIPVITLGLPTVVNADMLVREFSDAQDIDGACRGMVVTPREIDVMIERGSRLLGYTINQALQPGYNPAELAAIAQ